LFKSEIKKLGYDFRIVTENTSLIVLETLEQYLKHGITPPETLPNVLKQYKERKTKEEQDEQKRVSEKIERIVNMWKERVNWHKKDFIVETAKKQLMKKEEASSQMDRCERSCAPSAPMARRCCSRSCAPSLSMASECCSRSSSLASDCDEEECDDSFGGEEEKCKKDKKEKGGKSEASVSGTIKVKAWSPDAAYTAAIAKASDQYKEYLNQRESYSTSPAFYLDVADMFLSNGKKVEGVRVLSNIAELELENVQLYRIIGYRLDQAEQLELAEWVFEKVKQIRPDEPQSYRDLALVKERMGKFKESMELFNKVITGKWDMRFDETLK